MHYFHRATYSRHPAYQGWLLQARREGFNRKQKKENTTRSISPWAQYDVGQTKRQRGRDEPMNICEKEQPTKSRCHMSNVLHSQDRTSLHHHDHHLRGPYQDHKNTCISMLAFKPLSSYDLGTILCLLVLRFLLLITLPASIGRPAD